MLEKHRSRIGFTLLEVLIALVILGIVTTIVFRSTVSSIHNAGRASDWQQEAVVVEKTIESLRKVHDAASLRALNSTATDSTSGSKIRVTVKGSSPSASICAKFPCDNLAQISVTAHRIGFPDSMLISTYLFAKAP